MWQQVVLAISEVLRSPRLCSNQDPVLLCFSCFSLGIFIGFGLGALVLSPSLQTLVGRVTRLIAEALLTREPEQVQRAQRGPVAQQLRLRRRPLFLPAVD